MPQVCTSWSSQVDKNALWQPGVCVYMYHVFSPRPLHVAARNGLTMVVQELLGKGASVLAVDENGKLVLYCLPLT